jgi:pimeloyl-ACP methyl ester carboxylesterase
MVARTLRFISLSIVALFVAAIAFSIRPDTSFDDLQRDYGEALTTYLPLPSGARAHYVDAGDPAGRPLLLLHGEGSSLQEWVPWVDQLGDAYRLILIDLPGHGLTGRVPGDDYSRAAMARFVVEVANGLGLGRFAVAGTDMGGGVAWQLARTHEDRVTHLVLVAPTGLGPAPGGQPLGALAARNPLTRPLARWISPRWATANHLYKSFADDHFVTAAMIDRTWRFSRLGENREAMVRRLALPAGRPLREYDGAIHVPTVVLWGEEDQILPLDRERVEWDLRTKFARGSEANPLYTFAGVGHRPHEEQALLSAAFAANFIETHGAGAQGPENPE